MVRRDEAFRQPKRQSLLARGGDYTIEGGTLEAQAQVHAALATSRFDWDVVPARITIRITRCGCAGSRPGEIVLDEDALVRSPPSVRATPGGSSSTSTRTRSTGSSSGPGERRALARRLGTRAWCYETPAMAHDDYGCERFATLLAWTYWRSLDNVRRPTWERRLRARSFRSLLARFVAA